MSKQNSHFVRITVQKKLQTSNIQDILTEQHFSAHNSLESPMKAESMKQEAIIHRHISDGSKH